MATIYVENYGDGTASITNATAAYNAASNGDTIVFPQNGSGTWASSLSISKVLFLNGNGTTLVSSTPLLNGFFYFTGLVTTDLVRVANFTFNAIDFSATARCLYFTENGTLSLTNLRVDHNNFHYGYEQIGVGGCLGVFDHNNFYNSRKAISFTAGDSLQANASWVSMAAGTSGALFIETNNFIDNANYPATYGQEKIGTYNGGKLVVRYNDFDFDNIVNLVGTASTILTHGSAAGGLAATSGYWQEGKGARRGQSVVEVYNNNAHGPRVDYMAVFRGSANLVYNNTLDTATFQPRIYVYEEEQYETSNWSPLRTAWPAEDQVHNTFLWNNTLRLNGVPNTGYFEVAASSTGYIQPNRDYFLHAPEASGGFEYFSGLNGASNTYPTDGSTYPTSGTMLFSTTGANAYYGYVPFTYPHPLTGPFSRLTRMGRYPRFGVYHAF